MGDTPLQYEGHGNWSSDILEQEASHVTSVPDATLTPLAFGAGTGNDLIDFTSTTVPVVKEAGNYTVVVNVSTPLSAAKHALLKLELDSGAADITFQKTVSLDTANALAGTVRSQIVGVAFIPEGGAIKVSAQHDIGSAANVTMTATITRG